MKLNFLLIDEWGAINDIKITGHVDAQRKRIVSIELTPEQVELLQSRYCGANCGKEMFEMISFLNLEVEEK